MTVNDQASDDNPAKDMRAYGIHRGATWTYSAAGDIALARGNSIVSTALVVSQRVLGRKEAKYSHAMLCVAPNIWVQATPFGGVDIYPESEVFRDGQFADVRIYRLPRPELARPDGAPNIEDAMNWVQREGELIRSWVGNYFYFHEQNYRFDVGLWPLGAKSRSFCSELVVKVYSRCRPDALNIGERKLIFPEDLDNIALTSNGLDITSLFNEGRKISASLPPRRLSEAALIEMLLKANERNLDIAIMSITSAKITVKTENILSELGVSLGIDKVKINETLSHAENTSWKNLEAMKKIRREIERSIEKINRKQK